MQRSGILSEYERLWIETSDAPRVYHVASGLATTGNADDSFAYQSRGHATFDFARVARTSSGRLGRGRRAVKAAYQCAGFRHAWFAGSQCGNAERADTLPVLQQPGSDRSGTCSTGSRRRFVRVPHMPRDMAPPERSDLAAESGLAGTQETQRRLILSNASVGPYTRG